MVVDLCDALEKEAALELTVRRTSLKVLGIGEFLQFRFFFEYCDAIEKKALHE